MDLDFEITAIKRKSDKKRFAVGEQIGWSGEVRIKAFNLKEVNGKIAIYVVKQGLSSYDSWETPLDMIP